MVFECAPVAAAQPMTVMHIQRCGNRTAVATGDDHDEVLRHAAADRPKKIEIQIRRRMMLAVGLAIAAVKKDPQRIGDRAAGVPLEIDACLADAAPLLLDLLALLMVERGEKCVEVRVVVVAPMEL